MALSQYGCDGGNLSSTIWACGLESGGRYDDNQITNSNMQKSPLGTWDLNGKKSYREVKGINMSKTNKGNILVMVFHFLVVPMESIVTKKWRL